MGFTVYASLSQQPVTTAFSISETGSRLAAQAGNAALMLWQCNPAEAQFAHSGLFTGCRLTMLLPQSPCAGSDFHHSQPAGWHFHRL